MLNQILKLLATVARRLPFGSRMVFVRYVYEPGPGTPYPYVRLNEDFIVVKMPKPPSNLTPMRPEEVIPVIPVPTPEFPYR